MHIPGVVGGAKPKAYTNWIVIESFDLDADRSMHYVDGSASPEFSSKQHSNALIFKMRDSSSIALLSAFYNGNVFEQVTIDRCDNDTCVDRVILHNVTITRAQTHMHDNALDEEFCFCYQKITHQHNPIDVAGRQGPQQIVSYDISKASLT